MKQKSCVDLCENLFVTKAAIDLAELIRRRKVTAQDVVQAYINRLNEVNPLLNAVVDGPFTWEALEEAKRIDDHLAQGLITEEEFLQKPFLGVPFTTKDTIAVKGKLHTLGLLARADARADEDAECIRLMRESGAIIIATSNVPEVNRWVETRNKLIGQTNNPYDVKRTAGGSSGGEGALISSCGSCIGVGTDFGGSIRIPSLYCGIFGHKPTGCAVNTRGCTFRTGDETNTMLVAGPMSRHAKDLLPMMKVLADPRYSAKLNLDHAVDVKKLRFFYCDDMGPKISEDMKEAVNKAKRHFECITGQKCIKAKFQGLHEASNLFSYQMSKEPGNVSKIITSGKDMNPLTELLKMSVGQSKITLPSVLSLLQDRAPPLKNGKELLETTDRLRSELEDLLGDDGVLIFPSTTEPAGKHYSPYWQLYKIAFFSIFNVLRVPVTQVPMGLNSQGLPVGIQVVATAFRDRHCLAVAEELDNAFGGWIPPFKIQE